MGCETAYIFLLTVSQVIGAPFTAERKMFLADIKGNSATEHSTRVLKGKFDGSKDWEQHLHVLVHPASLKPF